MDSRSPRSLLVIDGRRVTPGTGLGEIEEESLFFLRDNMVLGDHGLGNFGLQQRN